MAQIVAEVDSGSGLSIHRYDDDTFEFRASAGGLQIVLARIPENVLSDMLATVSKGAHIEGHADSALKLLRGEKLETAKEAEAVALALVR